MTDSATEETLRAATQAGWRRIPVWIADHELWFLLLIILPLIFPNRLTPLGLAFIPLLWLCRRLARGRLTVRTPMDLPILGLLAMLPVSLYVSTDLALSQVVLYQIVAGVALFYGLANGPRSSAAVGWAVAGLAGVGVALAMAAPVSVEWPASKLFALPQIYRHFSVLLPEAVNRNVMAGALVMIIPIVASLLLYGRFGKFARKQILVLRGGLGLILILMLAAFFLTQSRGALIALAVGALVLAAVRWQWLVMLGAAYGLALVIGAKYLEFTPVLDWISSTDTIHGWAWRQGVWSKAVYMLQDFPYTGIGLGTFRRVAPVMYPIPPVDLGFKGNHAHNLFLQVGVDLGLPGLVAFIAILAASLIMTWQTFRWSQAHRRPDQQALALGLFASLTVMVVHGLLDAVTWGTKTAIVPWYVMGLAVALRRRAR